MHVRTREPRREDRDAHVHTPGGIEARLNAGLLATGARPATGREALRCVLCTGPLFASQRIADLVTDGEPPVHVACVAAVVAGRAA